MPQADFLIMTMGLWLKILAVGCVFLDAGVFGQGKDPRLLLLPLRAFAWGGTPVGDSGRRIREGLAAGREGGRWSGLS